MSLAAACSWSVLRSLSIALLALPLCRLLSEQLSRNRGVSRLLTGALLLVPFFTPELMVGYAYANYTLWLVRSPLGNELFYAALVSLKMIPVGTVMLYFAPPSPLSAEAIHCRRLAFRRPEGGWNRRLTMARFQMRGPMRAALPAFSVLFLLSFQEFEMASLLQSTSWTVWLFDAQAGGLFLSESLRFSVLPVVLETAILLPVMVLVLKNGRLPAAGERSRTRSSTVVHYFLYAYLMIAVTIVFAFPLASIGQGTFGGLHRLWENRSQANDFLKEILTGIVFALTSGILTYAVSAGVLATYQKRQGHPGRWRIITAVVLSVPGLLGSLVLCLSILFLFQRPGFVLLYDTPVPVVLSSILFLMPRAMLLQLLLLAVSPGETHYLANLLKSSPLPRQRDHGGELIWQIQGRARFWSAMLLCYWVYWDLTTLSILAPAGVTSAPVRLYNLMHYGHNAVLSAMTCLTLTIPLMLLVFVASARRQVLRKKVKVKRKSRKIACRCIGSRRPRDSGRI